MMRPGRVGRGREGGGGVEEEGEGGEGGGGGLFRCLTLVRRSSVCSSLSTASLSLSKVHRLVGLVVRRPPPERKIPGSNPACAGIFSGSSHTSDLENGTPVATLPGAWRYRVSTGTGRPGVSILWLGEVERLTCNFYLSVAARKIV